MGTLTTRTTTHSFINTSEPAKSVGSFRNKNKPLVLLEEFNGSRFVGDYNSWRGVLPVQYRLITSQKQLDRLAIQLSTQEVLALDTETSNSSDLNATTNQEREKILDEALDPYLCKLLVVQIGTPEVCYNISGQLDFTLVRQLVLENPAILKLLQNAKFDYKVLAVKHGIRLVNFYDTMLAERVLTAGRQGAAVYPNLKQLAYKYTGEEIDKSVRMTFGGVEDITRLNEEQMIYAAKDCFVLFPIYAGQMDQLKESEGLLQIADLENRCVIATSEIEIAGVEIDTAKWRLMLKHTEEEKRKVKQELLDTLPGGRVRQLSVFALMDEDAESETATININSGPQIISEFKKLGIEIADTTDDTLSKVNHPAAKLLRKYREYEKQLTAFGEKLLSLRNSTTGRFHPNFFQYGADTGRYSCASPNIQQIPAMSDFRSCFVPKKDYKFIVCDYAQQEIRLAAELTGDMALIQPLLDGTDLHKFTASLMFNKPIEEIGKDSYERKVAKTIAFGLFYGMGAQGLANRLEVSLEEGERLMNRYFEVFAGVKKWLDHQSEVALENMYAQTALGRREYFWLPAQGHPDFKKRQGTIKRKGKNTPIQGSGADMIKLALIWLEEALRPLDARMVMVVHDEIVVEAREDQAEEAKRLVEECMVRAMATILKKVPSVADPAITDYWKK